MIHFRRHQQPDRITWGFTNYLVGIHEIVMVNSQMPWVRWFTARHNNRDESNFDLYLNLHFQHYFTNLRLCTHFIFRNPSIHFQSSLLLLILPLLRSICSPSCYKRTSLCTLEPSSILRINERSQNFMKLTAKQIL